MVYCTVHQYTLTEHTSMYKYYMYVIKFKYKKNKDKQKNLAN